MEFFYTCHMLRERLSIPTEKIGNVDEVPVHYDMTDLYTLDSQQNSNPVVLTGGGEKKRVTVILSCCADGRKLTPVIIYGGTTKKSIEGLQVLNHTAILSFQENAWNTTEGMKKWLEEVWIPNVPGQSLVVLDHFRCHDNEEFQLFATERNVRLAFIPQGCTPLVQPLDVSLNKPFKDRLRKIWTDFMVTEIGRKVATSATLESTVASPSDSTVPKITKQILLDMIVSAWADISPETVKKSFLRCGISNSLDGSEENEFSINLKRAMCLDSI